jgi:hypothetical protein
MIKVESRILAFLLMLGIALAGCIANFQQTLSAKAASAQASPRQSQPVQSQPAPAKPAQPRPDLAKQELARAILSEAGIAKQYNLHLGVGIDMALSPETAKKTKFVAWLESLLVREAGWKYAENTYAAQLVANFSDAELQELLSLVKQPLLKKLAQTEMKSYKAATEERRRLLSNLWDNYTRGLFVPPPDAMP